MTSYKRTFIPQIDARDCGVAALASIAKFYGSDYSLAHLRELAKTNKEGTIAYKNFYDSIKNKLNVKFTKVKA
ncbi:MAG: cysteine peptidase family C39 domain-containing protein, partial [Streptococcus mitis]|nr:cysteine peptidase family C39 domain-containing protein [Streptococcus mitis]